MRVVVDTSVWSLALRRRAGSLAPAEGRVRDELTALVEEGRVVMLGIIRQELLSGIKRAQAFEELREALRAFPDEPLVTDDHEEAARLANACRGAGVAGGSVDFLIAAVAVRRRAPVFALDQDFQRYAKHAGLALHALRE